MEKFNSRNGQVGLLVLLATIVVMTIAVALASRTASEIAISTNEEQSTSAFESAETIIERILGNPTPPPAETKTGLIGSESYQVTTEYVTKLKTDEKAAGETVEVNLKNYAQNTFKVEWQGNNQGSCNNNASAVVVAIFYENSPNDYKVKRYAYDPCLYRADTGPNPNGFLHINSANSNKVTINGGRATANVPSRELSATPPLTNPVSARIKILYANSDLFIEGGNGFPQQGIDITSRASSLDDQSRAIRVTESYPMAPSIFDYAVYSAGTIENVGP